MQSLGFNKKGASNIWAVLSVLVSCLAGVSGGINCRRRTRKSAEPILNYPLPEVKVELDYMYLTLQGQRILPLLRAYRRQTRISPAVEYGENPESARLISRWRVPRMFVIIQ